MLNNVVRMKERASRNSPGAQTHRDEPGGGTQTQRLGTPATVTPLRTGDRNSASASANQPAAPAQGTELGRGGLAPKAPRWPKPRAPLSERVLDPPRCRQAREPIKLKLPSLGLTWPPSGPACRGRAGKVLVRKASRLEANAVGAVGPIFPFRTGCGKPLALLTAREASPSQGAQAPRQQEPLCGPSREPRTWPSPGDSHPFLPRLPRCRPGGSSSPSSRPRPRPRQRRRSTDFPGRPEEPQPPQRGPASPHPLPV